jgi:dihydrofolate reductase
MPKVRVAAFGVSLDGFSAGPEQSLNEPLGKRGPEIFEWFFHTRSFRAMHGLEGGSTDLDDEFARSFENVGRLHPRSQHVRLGARPMAGRLMEWVVGRESSLPHASIRAHASSTRAVEMQGGTTFYFVTGGIEEALERAKQAAGDKDVRVGGGVSTIRQYLQAGSIDSLHLAVSPVFLGQGEALFQGIDLPALGFSVTERQVTEHATHVVLEKR